LFTVTVVITKYKLRPSHSLQTVLLSSTVYSFLFVFFFFIVFTFCSYGVGLLACSCPELISSKYESFGYVVLLLGREGPVRRYIFTCQRKYKEKKTWIHFHSLSGIISHDARTVHVLDYPATLIACCFIQTM